MTKILKQKEEKKEADYTKKENEKKLKVMVNTYIN